MRASKPRLNIAALRKKTGLTQRQLAEKLGVTPDTIANWERGRVNLWHIEIFVKLCEIFNCSHKELVELEKDELSVLSIEKDLGLDIDLEEMRESLGTNSHAENSAYDMETTES